MGGDPEECGGDANSGGLRDPSSNNKGKILRAWWGCSGYAGKTPKNRTRREK